MVASNEILEVIQIPMALGRVSWSGYEEAQQEQDYNEGDEEQGIFGCRPESTLPRSTLLLKLDFVILLVPKVGERDYDQAQQRIDAIQAIVYDLEGEQYVVDPVGSRPILLGALRHGAGGGNEGYIDRKQKDGGEQRRETDDCDYADNGGTVARRLPCEGCDDGCKEAADNGYRVSDPD